MSDAFRIAAVQAAPVWFDREKSTDKACELIRVAADGGAVLAAFGETWIPGYPVFAQGPGLATMLDHADEYLANAVDIPGPVTDGLGEAARGAGIDVVIGVVERDPYTAGTVYATALMIGSDGAIVGKHRKLKPTMGERVAWGDGDASGLRVHQRSYARVSMLNCWEHSMLLPGYVLMAEGTQVHIGLWPGDEPMTRQLMLSRAFAAQAAAYVICVGGLRRPEDLPDDLKDVLPGNGGSHIIDAFGSVVAGPAIDEQTIYADVSLASTRVAKAMCDVAGHYSRPDIFRLSVDRRPGVRVETIDSQVDPTEASGPSMFCSEP
jgi:predicted amidohydrolase